MIELQFSISRKTADSKAKGDDQAFKALQNAHDARLRRFCLRLCGGSADDAADLAQETWLAAYQSLPRFQSRAKVTTWLFRIALFQRRRVRGASLRDAPFCPTDDTSAALSTPDPALSTIRRLALADALLLLSDAQREAFLLVKAEQFTHREAAAILQIPQGTVQARVHESVRRLRLLLADTEETNVQ